MVVLPVRDRRAVSLRDLSLEGVAVVLGPVPVKVNSDTPSSRCFGDCLPRAMFDFGDGAYANLETDRE
jgi:hypothetical protein